MVKKTDYDVKITEIKNRISSTNGLFIYKKLIREIENKISNVSNFDTKLTKIDRKLNNISDRVITINKTRQVEAGKKLNNLITSKLINNISRDILQL